MAGLFHLSDALARVFSGGSSSRREEEVVVEEDAFDGNVFQEQLVLSRAIESSPGRPLRLLCLHGKGSNNDITAIQLVSLDVHTCVEADLVQGGLRSAAYSPLFRQLSDRQFRAWVEDVVSPEGLEGAMRRVLEIVKRHGPYDGLYGFSQGAAVVTMLSLPGMARKLGYERSWHFVVCACGVNVGWPLVEWFYDEGCAPTVVDLPSLHIIGRADPIGPLSHKLVEAYQAPTVVTHRLGHELPVALRKDARFQAQVHDFLRRAARPPTASEAAGLPRS